MRASKRYEIVGSWATVSATVARPWRGEEQGLEVRITREVADIRDTQDGHVYDDGSYRVTGRHLGGGSYLRSKTFYGETAWSDSRRLAEDTVNQVIQFREGR